LDIGMTGQWKKVARLADLEPEYPTRIKLGEREVALCLVDGEVFAIDNICSHAFALLSDGHVEGHELFCPMHGGSFDVRTGEAVGAPCTVDLTVFPTKIENDEVFLDVELVT
jgi:nitrite reductase/ring-hydroxylating ferredoxin subunit